MYHYSTSIEWKEEKKGTLFIEGKPDLTVVTPPEFDGHEGAHSPEDLFVASIAGCTMTTFLAFAQKTRTKFSSFTCSAEGEADIVDGQLQFTKIILKPTATVPSEREKKHALHVMKLLEKHCLVSNSVRCTIELHPEIIIM
jgi:organic hydroperoxide reductase OsmC/OhrA